MLNEITLMGRLTKDVELRGKDENKFLYNTLAVDRNYKKKGEDKAETDFFTIRASGYTAEHIAKYFTKGSLIIVSGELATAENKVYTSEKGNVAITAIVSVSNAYFTGERKKQDEAPAAKSKAEADKSKTESTVPDFEEMDGDEDLPF